MLPTPAAPPPLAPSVSDFLASVLMLDPEVRSVLAPTGRRVSRRSLMGAARVLVELFPDATGRAAIEGGR